MDGYGIPDSPYGVRGMGAYGLPVARTPAPMLPPPITRPVLPPAYLPALRLPQMRQTAAPLLNRMSEFGNRVAQVLPFPAVQHAAEVVQSAANSNSNAVKEQSKERPITLADITAWQRKAESSGNYSALNRERKGNTASGAYQYTDSTWNGYGGYNKALYAPPEVQDKRFAEDIAARYHKYGGDPFKTIAAHYLPAFADNPKVWRQPLSVKGTRVRPIEQYIRHVIKGTPLEEQFDEYLAANRG